MSADSKQPDPPLPARPSLRSLREAAQHCQACELWRGATQAVVGQGARNARLMLVGEQPGDREDIEGHPFVGPAGGVLDYGLEQAGIVRAEVFVTNMVKHIAELVTLTSHPSSILRERDDAARRAAIDAFVADLAQVAQWLN